MFSTKLIKPQKKAKYGRVIVLTVLATITVEAVALVTLSIIKKRALSKLIYSPIDDDFEQDECDCTVDFEKYTSE